MNDFLRIQCEQAPVGMTITVEGWPSHQKIDRYCPRCHAFNVMQVVDKSSPAYCGSCAFSPIFSVEVIP